MHGLRASRGLEGVGDEVDERLSYQMLIARDVREIVVRLDDDLIADFLPLRGGAGAGDQSSRCHCVDRQLVRTRELEEIADDTLRATGLLLNDVEQRRGIRRDGLLLLERRQRVEDDGQGVSHLVRHDSGDLTQGYKAFTQLTKYWIASRMVATSRSA